MWLISFLVLSIYTYSALSSEVDDPQPTDWVDLTIPSHEGEVDEVRDLNRLRLDLKAA